MVAVGASSTPPVIAKPLLVPIAGPEQRHLPALTASLRGAQKSEVQPNASELLGTS